MAQSWPTFAVLSHCASHLWGRRFRLPLPAQRGHGRSATTCLQLKTAGGTARPTKNASGVTLLEMLIVVTIIATIVSLSFPSLVSGLAGIRLASSASSVASFLTSSMNTVERHEQAAAIVVNPKENRLDVFTAISGEKPAATYQMPASIALEGDEPRRYVLFPGGAFPRIAVVLRNEKGARRSIEIDPVTAVPQVTRIEDAPR